MFLRDCWYCAGWDHRISLSKGELVKRRIAGEPVMLYRKPDGELVAMEDRCCHRQAPLSLGMRDGDGIRCGYHGIKFGPDGRCVEIPGQRMVPRKACVRTYPVAVRNGWIWVWMGEPSRADPALICFSVGPDNPDWNIRTGEMAINTDYRLEIANLVDLSHVAWVHRTTLGGTTGWAEATPTHTMLERGINTAFWLPGAEPPAFAAHLFAPEARFDIHVDYDVTLPCNFVLHFEVWSPGTAAAGKEAGQLLLDSYSSQAVTPRDADWVDYYYSWGLSRATDVPGLSLTLREATDAAFLEDKAILEAQHRNIRERPDGNLIDIRADAGPNKLLHLLDRLLAAERDAVLGGRSAAAAVNR